MSKDKLKIIFFGTPEFAAHSLAKLLEEDVEIAAVVTMPDKIGGRGHKIIQSDVKRFAEEKGLTILQPSNLKAPEFINTLHDFKADLFIVIAFRMLPEAVWQMPPLGTFNLHASLLPKFRGAAPINWAVINGEEKTGVTTFFLKHEIDTGDIIDREEVMILPEDNAGTLHDKLMEIGGRLVVETVRKIKEGTLTVRPQPEGEFIPAPKIFADTCKINWNDSARKIHNLIRGLSPYPGARSVFYSSRTGEKKNDIKILKSRYVENKEFSPKSVGEVFVTKEGLFVTADDGILELLEVQPSGKSVMDGAAFARGYNPVKFV